MASVAVLLKRGTVCIRDTPTTTTICNFIQFDPNWDNRQTPPTPELADTHSPQTIPQPIVPHFPYRNAGPESFSRYLLNHTNSKMGPQMEREDEKIKTIETARPSLRIVPRSTGDGAETDC